MGIYNQFKTLALLSMLTVVLLWVGSLFGQYGLIIGFVFAIIMNAGSYWYSDKLVLKMYKAQEVGPGHKLHSMMQELSQMANLPMPKVYILPSAQPNAFATGRNENHAAVAFSQGIMELLNDHELKGVAAHELAHIKNKDMLITTIAATLGGVIAYAANMAQWAMIFGGSRNRDGADIVQLLVMIIVAPLAATIIQLSISRSREYLADEKGARFVQDPSGLASALRKLDADKTVMRRGSKATSSLFIKNPFKANGFAKLFSTHPPMDERIKRLENLRL